jgi:hypothetical protein
VLQPRLPAWNVVRVARESWDFDSVSVQPSIGASSPVADWHKWRKLRPVRPLWVR